MSISYRRGICINDLQALISGPLTFGFNIQVYTFDSEILVRIFDFVCRGLHYLLKISGFTFSNSNLLIFVLDV